MTGCPQQSKVTPRKLLFWNGEKICAKFFSPKAGDFSFGQGRVCPTGYRPCGRTLSDYLCVKPSVNCPINQFFMLKPNDPDPVEIRENPNFYYYNLPLRDGTARLVFTRDNPEGLLLTDDFRIGYERICLDQEESIPGTQTGVFEFYRDVTFKEKCSDLVNKYLNNMQYVKCNYSFKFEIQSAKS